MSRNELLEYASEYEEAKSEINPYSFEDPIWPSDGFSEDSADDFTAWVVSLGDSMYDRLREEPTRIHEFYALFEESRNGVGLNRWDKTVDRPEYRGWQSATGLAVAIYEIRFGRTFHKDLTAYEKGKRRSSVP